MGTKRNRRRRALQLTTRAYILPVQSNRLITRKKAPIDLPMNFHPAVECRI
ncbi:hypothetical protein SAMN05216328_1379 [Ensifer sp. YR511]|nr:hypothetical protein SAMN05216328_1379 [Ensifer sp. YR511]